MKKKYGQISSKISGNKAGFREKYFPENSPFFKEILIYPKQPRGPSHVVLYRAPTPRETRFISTHERDRVLFTLCYERLLQLLAGLERCEYLSY